MTDVLSVSIDRLALGGDGVGRLPAGDAGRGGPVVFVPYTAPGERVLLDSIKTGASFSRGWPARVEVSSPQRVEPRCPHFFHPGRAPSHVCGGCDWQHLAAPAQAEAKRALLTETLQRIGKIARPPVEDTVSAPAPEAAWGYRNKALVPFARDAEGKLVAGFYAPRSHTVVPLEACPVQMENFVPVVHSAREALARADAVVYDSAREQGWLRHLMVRTNTRGQTLVALVTTSQAPPVAHAFAQALRQAHPFVYSVYQNINDRPGNVVLGPRWRHIAGPKDLEETILDLKFRLSPGVFFQVNPRMAERLFALAVQMASAGPTDVVWELYAGVGVMGQLLARRAKLVWAVEENAAAVRDGIQSLALNGVDNVRFRQGRCELVLARGLIKDRPTVVLLDPPRAGCDRAVLRAVLRAHPRRIVYVSCDPGTLARDAHTLSTGGYHLRRAVPVDLFPQTAHIESVSLFEPVRPQ